ncbi:hypothetical protein [Aeromonas phage 32]|nr:hypothetical protein [Aeromonas phage 32]
MKASDLITLGTTLSLLIGFFAFTAWSADQSLALREAELAQAAQSGRAWMADTTAKLEATLAGIEQITGETLQLSQRVDDLADRLDRADL